MMKLRKVALLAVLFLSLTLNTARADAPEHCLASQLARITHELPVTFEKIQRIAPALIRGEQTPKWSDFEALKEIIADVRKTKKSAAETGRLKELEVALKEIEKSVPGNPALVGLRDASKGAKPGKSYTPGEYELKREYQHLLWALNRELPPGLKIRGVRLPFDTRKPALIAQARALVKQQENRFKPFLKDSGFPSMKGLKSALNAHSESSRKLLQLFENGAVEFAMNRPESARWWVPRVGFQNQRITGTSRGSMNPGYRDQVEAKMTGMDLNEYKSTDHQFKPVYGYLKPSPHAELQQSMAAAQYGEDVYIFKKDKVGDRLTWTAGDSFGPVHHGPDTPSEKPKNWKGFFIPWKYHPWIIPDTLGPLSASRRAFEAGPPQELAGLFPELPKMPNPPPPPTLKPLPQRPMPPEPVYPPYPELPTRPAMEDYPTEPARITPPQGLKAPLMPALKEGETFESALAKFRVSPEMKRHHKKLDRLNREYQEKLRLQSAEWDIYNSKRREVMERNALKEKAYLESDAYQAYRARENEVNAQRQLIRQEFEKSDTWLKYQADLKQFQDEYDRINAENGKIQTAHRESDAYKRHIAEYNEYSDSMRALRDTDKYKWYQHNLSANPYFNFHESPLAPFSGPHSHGYIELQYWGPITLDDLETFEFRKTPPSGEFLEKLREHGVKIRDGRVDPAVEWRE